MHEVKRYYLLARDSQRWPDQTAGDLDEAVQQFNEALLSDD